MLGRVVVLILLVEYRYISVASSLTDPILHSIHDPPARVSLPAQISYRTDDPSHIYPVLSNCAMIIERESLLRTAENRKYLMVDHHA
jgi:hypothetical protein